MSPKRRTHHFVTVVLSLAVGISVLLPVSISSAVTYVTVSVKFSDDAGNTPLENSYAEAYTGYNTKVSSSKYESGGFRLNVPQGTEVKFRLVYFFYPYQGNENLAVRTKVPSVEFWSPERLTFSQDSEIQVKLMSPKILTVEVTDAQLNTLKNVLITETRKHNSPISINGLTWRMIQSQAMDGYWSFSPNGKFQIAYYPIRELKVEFTYWETGSQRPPNASGMRVDTPPFFIEDFNEIFLCTPVNFDSTKATNKKCFENVLALKMAERTTQEAAVRAAAEKAAAEKAAIAAAERKAARDQAAANAKKTTITCVKGKVSKKVTAVKPQCPSGYKLKK
jgi:hypothetical protein